MAEFGPDEEALRLKRTKTANYKKFTKGFSLITSFRLNLEASLELSRKNGTPDEIRSIKEKIESFKNIEDSLEEGDPKPLIVQIIEIINNNLRFIKDYSLKELKEEPNRFEIIKDLVDTLEELKIGE